MIDKGGTDARGSSCNKPDGGRHDYWVLVVDNNVGKRMENATGADLVLGMDGSLGVAQV